MTVPDTNEVQLAATLRAKSGQEAALRYALQSIIPLVQVEPGCLRYDMHEDRENPARIVMLEAWESEEALAQHGAAAAFTSLAARFNDLLAEPLTVIRLKRIG